VDAADRAVERLGDSGGWVAQSHQRDGRRRLSLLRFRIAFGSSSPLQTTSFWSEIVRHPVVDIFQLPNCIVEFAPRRCYISPFQRSLAVFKLPPYRLDFLLEALLTRDASRRTGRQEGRWCTMAGRTETVRNPLQHSTLSPGHVVEKRRPLEKNVAPIQELRQRLRSPPSVRGVTRREASAQLDHSSRKRPNLTGFDPGSSGGCRLSACWSGEVAQPAGKQSLVHDNAQTL